MLGFAQAGQVGINHRRHRAAMAQVGLDLAQVLPLFEQVRGIGMAQGVDVGRFGHPAGLKRQPEGPLQRGAAHGLGRRARPLAAVAFGGKEKAGVTMGFPLLAQKLQRALRQWHVTILVTLAGTDVQEHAFRINVGNLEAQAFTQTQAAGVNGRQAHPLVQGGDGGQEAAHFGRRKDDREFELGIGAGQLQLVRPDPAQGLFPEDLDGADGLGAGLAGDLLVALEVDAILADVFRREQIGRFAVELAQLPQAGVVSLLGAGADGQELEVIGERF